MITSAQQPPAPPLDLSARQGPASCVGVELAVQNPGLIGNRGRGEPPLPKTLFCRFSAEHWPRNGIRRPLTGPRNRKTHSQEESTVTPEFRSRTSGQLMRFRPGRHNTFVMTKQLKGRSGTGAFGSPAHRRWFQPLRGISVVFHVVCGTAVPAQ